MRLGLTAATAGLLALALPAIGAAQGIGDAAAREKAKRDKAKTAAPARLITNDDLDEGRPAGEKSDAGTGASTAEPAAPSSESAPSASAPAPSSEDRSAGLRPYIEAKSAAEARVGEIESRIRDLGGKLNPMSTTFIYGGTGSNSPAEEAEVRQQLQDAETQLGDARKALAAATEAFDRARQGGSAPPPGEP